MAKKNDDKNILSRITNAAKSGKKTSKNTSGTRKAKSKQQQAKELGIFAVAAAAAGTAVAKKASKGKTSKQKKVINGVAFVLVLCVLVCGGMFYMDISPFNFEISGNFFKFYEYENILPSTTLVTKDGADFRMHIIDVGQGDCILLQLPDGKNMLIDGANKRTILAKGIVDYLLSSTVGIADDGVATLDYVLLTHTDADHCGSLDDVIASDSVNVKNVYRPMIMSSYQDDPLKTYVSENNYEYSTITTGTYRDFVKAATEEENCNTYFNIGELTLSGEGYCFYFYNPSLEMYKDIKTAADKNNVSPVILLEIYGKKICLTGDADQAQEQNFVDLLADTQYGLNTSYADVDILKVGHHGGKESSNDFFLDVVKPEVALISVGDPNSYGHPTAQALTRLQTVGCEDIFRTDKNGTIVVNIDASSLISYDFGKQEVTATSNIFRQYLKVTFLAKQLLCSR